jgi:branched-chain amino acid transport system permease protein
VGYSGLWSFCPAALFGVSAYTTGVLITRYDIASFWLSAPAGALAALIASGIIGLIALRVSTVYFLLITLALGQLVFAVAMRWRGVTGGSKGLAGVPYPDFGFSPPIGMYPIGMYYFVLIVFILCFFLLNLITKSPFGVSLQGIREKEVRMICLGYNTWLHKYLSFLISGVFAGVAGILYVHYNGLVAPIDIDAPASGFLWLMLIIGGTGTLWGALVGTSVILSLEYIISMYTPERWPLIVGTLFIVSVMSFRRGIFPYLSTLWLKVTEFYVKS